MKLLFLDVDGVANGHDWDEAAQSNRLRYSCIRELNRIVAKTEAKIVLSSAWRYMVHSRAMTLDGFGYMLRTHGGVGLTPIGLTATDEECPKCGSKQKLRGRKRLEAFNEDGYRVCVVAGCGGVSTRGAQITAWLRRNTNYFSDRWPPYVVLDDDDLGISAEGHPLVLTNGEVGLTVADADRAIELLGKVVVEA